MTEFDAIVVGGGHNGLTAAAYLARAGRRVLVLERRGILGGAAVSEEVWPGWRVSTAAYLCSLLHPEIIAELDLAAHGFEAYRKRPASFTPLLDGRSLLLGAGTEADAREIAAFDPLDVAGYELFENDATRLGAQLANQFDELDRARITLDLPARRTFEGSAADLVEHYIRTPVLAATLATDGVIGTYAGPRDGGTGYVLAHHYAGRALGTQGAWGFVRGGMGGVSNALAAAARAAGAELRTGVDVARILCRSGKAYGVVLADGGELHAATILSNADPHTTFGRLLDHADLPTEIAAKLRTWRSEGVSLKLNLALGELPNFTSRPGASAQPHHNATIHVAPDIDYLQRACDDARAGSVSAAPMLECFMQTPTDETIAPKGKHLLSIFAQYYPYERGDGPWDEDKRDAAADVIVATLARYAPNLPAAIEARQILAPPDLEARFGLHRGHIFHGELLPGQILDERFPARTGIDRLFLCGSGAWPGGCVSGIPGRNAARAALAQAVAA